ncbi:40S ribosomal protein S27 [Manis javanica]|nr:40S ribosomal protein S27 [Manis javanica]
MPLAKDLLHPSPEEEKRKHKKKRLVQSPNSYFMDVKCPGCYKITTVFSHAQTGGKQGLQKDALSDGSSTKSTLHQDEWETIPINTFWIHPVYCLVLLLGSSTSSIQGQPEEWTTRVIWGNL